MKIVRLTLASVCLLLLCSCATTFHQATIVPATELPAAVTMNQGAGRGELLIVTVRLADGKKLPMLVDTGTPIMCLDKSFEPELGKRLGSVPAWNFGAKHKADYYKAPELYLGNTRLMTGKYVAAWDCKRQFSGSHHPVMGILGMDCLKHYCIQLDFKAGRIRFLDPHCLDTTKLGQGFPLVLSSQGEGIRGFFLGMVHPIIRHRGLLGKGNGKLLIDTGDNIDGKLEPKLFQREVREQEVVLTVGKSTWFPKCTWNGETYTNLIIGKWDNSIGLRFLARHLVTFDFPKRMMYLKQTSIGPLAGDSFVKDEAAARSAATILKPALKFLKSLARKGRLPGMSKGDKGTLNANSYCPETPHPESVTFTGRKNGDKSIYHYTVTRVAKDGPWKLQKAWRTDAKNHTIEEYPVP